MHPILHRFIHLRRQGWKFWAAWGVFALFAALLCIQGVIVVIHTVESDDPLCPMLGNHADNIKLLADLPQVETFRFAVVGDTHDTYTFQRLARELRGERLDFLAVIGDFVPSASIEHHTFFRNEYCDEVKIGSPVLLIPGNHDIDEEDFGLAEFEELYGPANFTIEHRGCLFVFLSVVGDSELDAPAIDLLEDLVAAYRPAKYRQTFVFMHVSPPVLDDVDAREYESVTRAGELVAALAPDYVFCGHHHGYARKTIGRTNYIVTGGGGDELADRKYGRFHHAMVMTVARDSVSEDILVVPHATDQTDRFEKYAMTDAYPWLAGNPVLAVSMTALVVGVMAVIVRQRCRSRR